MSDKHWIISVDYDGEHLVSIEPHLVSGKDMSEEERAAACRAVRNLAAFLGCEELENE